MLQQSQKENQKTAQLKREHVRQETLLKIRSRYGKTAILKGMNFEEGATDRERNQQIGGILHERKL